MFIPAAYSVGHAVGAGDTDPIAMSGIQETDALLAVVSWPQAGGTPIGHDVSDFVVGAGTITSATVDTEGEFVMAIWTPGEEEDS